LADLLRGHRRAELVEKRLRESRSVLAFFHELHDIVERTSFTTRKERPSLPLHTFLTVAQEIKEIQQDYSPLGSKPLLENDKDGDDQAAEMISIKGEFTLLSDDLSSLEYTTCDESGREHALVIRIPPGYPQSPPQVASASGLPVEFTPHKFTSRRRKLKNYEEEEEEVRGSRSYVAKKSSDGDDGVVRVRDVVCCFEALVLDLQPFWEATDALDSRAWVLEPERPDRSCTHRRVLLNHHHVSMLVEFSPLEMGDEHQGFSTPFKQVSFLGASEHVERLEEQVRNHNINQSGDDLDLSLSLSPACGGGKKKKKKKMVDVVEHLEGMLGMKLPSRTSETTMEETTGMMCGICYSYKITRNSTPSNDDDDDAKNSTIQVPEIACENKNCGYLFHKECLLEWLQSDQSSRQTFNTMFGSCPYCSDPIVCKRTI
jgi:E3 ubiquitin-protein ligase FANCL